MNEHTPEDLNFSKSAIEMFTVANEYCLFFEEAEKYESEQLLAYFQRIAPLLYLKGCLLPEIKMNEEVFSGRFVTEEQWEDIFKTLRLKFGPDDQYFVPDQNFDIRQASVSDNLADIYQDMKDFAVLFQKGDSISMQNALAQVKSLFIEHWGPTLINALGAVHNLVFRNQIDHDLFKDPIDEWD